MAWPKLFRVIPKSPKLWIFAGVHVGQASRLTSNDIRPQARRLRYIPEVQKHSDFGIKPGLPKLGDPRAMENFQKAFRLTKSIGSVFWRNKGRDSSPRKAATPNQPA
jgi:hypothetical protein